MVSERGKSERKSANTSAVLILVLVEDGLGEAVILPTSRLPCLNPCFSGGWSRSTKSGEDDILRIMVLILVLVEDGLGVSVFVTLAY